MEGAGSVASLALDCEDMFKEITKKLYGEEATEGVALEFGVAGPAGPELDDARPEEHLTAWGLAALMQHGVPPPGILQANFTPRTDPTAEDRWTAAEEPLAWAHSRVAAYNPAQRLFKCADCECVGFLARVAEHWLGTHSHARAFQCPLQACGFASGWARAVRQHLARDHHSDPAAADHLLRDNPALDDLTRYLQRLKAKVESLRHERRPSSGGSASGAEGAAAGGGPPPGPAVPVDGDGKRYICGACPYATDRRDLFTRHENIHRDEKPFHCYLCQKQFNRADHVKKHFLRMHRDQPYDLNRIRRHSPKASPPPPAPGPAPAAAPAPLPPAPHYYSKPAGEPPPPPPPPLLAAPAPPPPHVEYRAPPPLVKQERVQLKSEPAPPPPTPPKPAPPAPPATAAQAPPSRRKGERRYACGYCAWSGVDNWCLKRHLNTHLKPFACALCEYKAARAERLATHVHKVHNKKACGKCAFLADDQPQLATHLRQAHHIESRNLKVPSASVRGSPAAAAPPVPSSAGAPSAAAASAPAGYIVPPPPQQTDGGQAAAAAAARRREARSGGGAARLFGYLEASDGSGDEYEAALAADYGAPPAPAAPAPPPPPPDHYARDKENAAPPLHHTAPPLHHDHCLRY